MLAVFINCFTVILGGFIGLTVGKRVSDSFKEIVFSCSGLVTVIMGIQMALDSSNFLVLLVAMLSGGFCGYALKIEESIINLGNRLEKSSSGFSSDKGNFAIGFMNSSVLFCSGAMSVVGSIQAGTTGNYNTILIKSLMDGCMAVVFGSIYGIGVVFSSIFILVYQGFFTLAGSWLEPLLGDVGITELSAAGGILLMMIGLGLIDVKKFKTGNFLPALIFAPVFAILTQNIF